MALNKTGCFLEGVRIANANNSFTYPSRSLIFNSTTFNSQTSRAEYVIFVSGQEQGSSGLDIADPDLKFSWTRNDHTISRFDWSGFDKRWDTLPGSSPESLGVISNSPRLITSVPDQDVDPVESPYSIYIGNPVRSINFVVIVVPSSVNFSPPVSGYVQISADKGELNFSNNDLSTYGNQLVYVSKQSFFDRIKFKGNIGSLPSDVSIDYNLFLNPIPGSSQKPKIRIGYQKYLIPIQYSTESQLVSPSSGYVAFSLDTGKLRFSSSDVSANLGESVYYSGVTLGEFSLSSYALGPTSTVWPSSFGSSSSFIGLVDERRYVFFCEPSNQPRYYYDVQLTITTPTEAPSSGIVVVNTINGKVYSSPDDPSVEFNATIKYLDPVHEIERGMSIQFYRSGANSSGFEQTSDLIENYRVSGQIISTGLSQSPFIQLPTIPIVNSYLKIYVEQGTTGGTFTGELIDNSKSVNQGLGYLLNLDSKQIKFSNRKTVSKTTIRTTSSIKLDDAAISSQGFELSIDSNPAIMDSDFSFSMDTGLIEFTETVGQDDPNNSLNFTAVVSLPNSISAPPGTFPSDCIGKFIFIKSGPDFGFFEILSFISSGLVLTKTTLSSAGSFTADYRSDREILADKFWTQILPELKKFKLYKGNSISGPFTQLTRTDFNVLATTGQVNLSTPSSNGDIFKIEYTSNDSTDEVNITPTFRTEFAGFKIRQEQGSYIQNTGIINFNTDGSTVNPDLGFTVYVDGLLQKVVTYQAPNQILISIPLTTQSVFIDYFIYESPGGNENFNVQYSPVQIDLPTITSGSNTVSLNGNVSEIESGSAILVDDTSILLVTETSYDGSSDITTVTVSPSIHISSDGSNLKYTKPINGDYLITETNYHDTLSLNTNFFYISGNVENSYKSGTVIIIDGDPYLVSNSNFLVAGNKTKVILTEKAIRSYILSVLNRTIRPIFTETDSFQTSKSARADKEFLLVLSGDEDKILVRGGDYDLLDGGIIKLQDEISGNSILECCYVARQDKPVGTVLDINYAYAIAPNSNNGLLGQRLLMNYDLYSPDTFFFRYETFDTFLPELVDSLKSSASAGGSGPNISNSSSLQTKDYGKASPYFSEQHYDNLDEMASRVLKFYNDQIDDLEDVLANYDGRVVGGTSNRFRFDGDRSGTKRSSYISIKNDIDDYIKLYDDTIVTNLNPLTFEEGPIYGAMWDYNSFSRLFPTARPSATVPFNGNVSVPGDFGKNLGSFGIKKLSGVGTFKTTPSRAKFNKIDYSGSVLSMEGSNNDPEGKWPPFYVGQKVFTYNSKGIQGSLKTISSITEDPFNITISPSTTSTAGSLLADISDSTYPGVHYYSVGRHVAVDFETGQVKNAELPPPAGPTSPDVLQGNELVDSDVTYFNLTIKPNRPPVLDGSLLDDRTQASSPQLMYSNELSLLSREQLVYSYYGTGIVSTLTTVTSSTISVIIGQTINFLTGPNFGSYVINTVGPSIGQFTVVPNFLSIDLTPQVFNITANTGTLTSIFSNELKVLRDGVVGSVASGAYIGNINSEVLAMEDAVRNCGDTLVSNSATILDTITIHDDSHNFTNFDPPIDETCIILIVSGSNRGVYQVSSFTSHNLVINTNSPFSNFISTGQVSYRLIRPESFTPKDLSKVASEVIRTSLAFASTTSIWASQTLSWSPLLILSIPARLVQTNNRITEVSQLSSKIESLLGKSGKLYDSRFLWISQRVDKKTGYLTQVQRSIQDRMDAEIKILEDQQKLLVANSL